MGPVNGAYAAFALVSAIRHRERTGEGSEVKLPLTDVAVGTVANLGRIAEVMYTGLERERIGNAVFGSIGRDFETADGRRIMIVAINERQWQGLVTALEIGPDLAAVERAREISFAGDEGARFVNRDAVFGIIERAVRRLDFTAIAERLSAHNVVHSGYQTMPEALADPRLVGANPIFSPATGNPSGFAYPAAGAFATLPGRDRQPAAPAPRNGEHSEAVLAERLGLSWAEIGRLVDAGIVGVAS